MNNSAQLSKDTGLPRSLAVPPERLSTIASFILLASAISFVLAWLIPNHYYPWSSFYNESAAFVGLLLLTVGATIARQREGAAIVIPRIAIALALVALFPVLDLLSGRALFVGDAVIATCYVLATSLAVVCGATMTAKDGERFVDRVAAVCLAGALSSGVIALVQWGAPHSFSVWILETPPGGRPYGNLAQPNNLATLLCCGVAAAVYLRERRHIGIASLCLTTLLLLSAIAATRSRTGLVILLGLGALVLLLRVRCQLRLSRIGLSVGLVLGFGLWLNWSSFSSFLELQAISTDERLNPEGGDVRLLLWSQLMDAVSRRPFFGYGWNQVAIAQVEVAAEYPRSVFAEHAHNLLVDLMVWNGALIGLLLAGGLGWWLISRMLRMTSTQGWYALSCIGALMIHAMLEFPHDYAYFLLPAGICAGVVEACYRVPSVKRAQLLVRPLFLGAAGVIGIVGFAVIASEYKLVEADYLRMRFESVGIEPRPRVPTAPDVHVLSQQREFIRFARTQATKGMSVKELDWMRDVAHRFPYPPALFRYALALGLNGRPQAAKTELLRLRQLHPEERFEEAVSSWKALAVAHPELNDVQLGALSTRRTDRSLFKE